MAKKKKRERLTGIYTRNLEPARDRPAPEPPQVSATFETWLDQAEAVARAAEAEWPWKKIDRAEALLRVQELQAGMDEVEAAIDSGDPERAAACALILGALHERFVVLPGEWAALQGRKSHEGAARGGEEKRLTTAEKQERTALYRAGLVELGLKHPNMKRSARIAKLAKQLGRGHSIRTIKTFLSEKNRQSSAKPGQIAQPFS